MNTAKVTTYSMTANNGRHVRKATRVTLNNGRVIDFTERMSKRNAISQANDLTGREDRQAGRAPIAGFIYAATN